MVTGAGEETDARPSPTRRLLIRWSVVFALIIVAFAATVLVVNSTIFSAAGFARSYLDALARHDVEAALAMPGVMSTQAAADTDEADASAPSDALLRREALGPLRGIELISDVDRGDGIHRVTFEYRFTAKSIGRSTFDVEHTGPRLGFFSSWSFAESPLAVLEVSPRNVVEFDANGATVIAPLGSDVANPYRVLVPGHFTLSHDSEYLASAPVAVTVVAAGEVRPFDLDVQANDEFVAAVESELAVYLDDCATQQVLLPTGCPFGKSISDRIDSLPQWSIVNYPAVTIVPGDQAGTWLVPATVGSAHLTVAVRSLFDGTVETLDEDVTFTVSYLLTLGADGAVTLSPVVAD
jgi:hypothetical protein